MFYAYMLRCADGSLYTGYTVDMQKRLAAHNSGTASKYTRVRLPVKLAYLEAYPSKREAMQRECAMKRLKKEEKERLICGFEAGPLPASAPGGLC
ncbi:MAG TPA: GIY-YIG nuclease family protein [Clostridia bacterium]|nr:GIY-YIG nuclease family protein [Clostridia bacterium]